MANILFFGPEGLQFIVSDLSEKNAIKFTLTDNGMDAAAINAEIELDVTDTMSLIQWLHEQIDNNEKLPS